MKTRASLFPPRENFEAEKEAPFAPFVKAELVAMMFLVGLFLSNAFPFRETKRVSPNPKNPKLFVSLSFSLLLEFVKIKSSFEGQERDYSRR